MNNLGKMINKLTIVNFMCQLGQATGPKYLVKLYSGCFCEGGFQIRLIFKQMVFEENRLIPQCKWVSFKELKSFKKKKESECLSSKKEFCQHALPLYQTALFLLSPDCWSNLIGVTYQVLDLPSLHNFVSQFLDVSL